MKPEFNPDDWLPSKDSDPYSVGSNGSPSSDLTAEVDKVVTLIEAAFEDITTSYADWINVGFAFVNEFGENGRKFYHRVSRFYNGYTKAETDKQYDQCLKSHGHGITIRTFFHMAKQAGIDVGKREGSDQCSVAGSENEGERERRRDGATGFTPSCHHPFTPSLPHSITPSSSGIAPSVSNDRCSESSGQHSGITPSLPHPLAPSSSGIAPSVSQELPTLPDALFDQLPEFFKKVVVMAGSKEERDMLFLGALVTLSSCLGKFSGYYGNRKVYPNLYLYVTAPASAGKGNLVMCRNLVDLIDEEKSNQSYMEGLMYDQQMREYNAMKNKDLNMDKPVKPPVRMLFIPANNSTTGFYQLLADNEGMGLLFETEGDTLTQAFKTDYGNFSDGVRKAFQHEPFSYYRRTDRENVRIRFPRLSMVISSTMGQLSGLIPTLENGLASRFMFYFINLKPVWNDVLARDFNNSWDDHFNRLGQEFYNLYNSLKPVSEIDFMLSPGQHLQFNAFFAQLQDKYMTLQGMDMLAIVRRLGLIAFRIMMVLTAMRIPETGDFTTRQECRDEDFHSALSIASVLIRHASYVVSQLPAEVKVVRGQSNKEKFFEELGERFARKDFVALARSLDINERTAERYVAAFCTAGLIVKTDYGSYMKKKMDTANYTEPG